MEKFLRGGLKMSRENIEGQYPFEGENWTNEWKQKTDIISFGQYVVMIFLAWVPFLNIILLVRWGFISKQGPNKRNFARAMLFHYGIAVLVTAAYIWLWLVSTSSI